MYIQTIKAVRNFLGSVYIHSNHKYKLEKKKKRQWHFLHVIKCFFNNLVMFHTFFGEKVTFQK